MKNFIEKLKKLSFRNIVLIFLGLLSVLIVINLLFFSKNNVPENVNNTVITDPDAEGYQVRQDNVDSIDAILPYDQDNYSLTRETVDGKSVIRLTYDETDPKALPAAFLYLEQYGLVEGDSRLIVTPRGHIDLF